MSLVTGCGERIQAQVEQDWLRQVSRTLQCDFFVNFFGNVYCQFIGGKLDTFHKRSGAFIGSSNQQDKSWQ